MERHILDVEKDIEVYRRHVRNMARARKMAGITQEQLAAEMGIKGPALSQIENGRRPRLETVSKFYHALWRLGVQSVEF